MSSVRSQLPRPPRRATVLGSRCALCPLEEVIRTAVEARHDDRTDADRDRDVAHHVARVDLGEATIDQRRGVGDRGCVDAERGDREDVGPDACDVGVEGQRGADRGAHAAQDLIGDLQGRAAR